MFESFFKIHLPRNFFVRCILLLMIGFFFVESLHSQIFQLPFSIVKEIRSVRNPLGIRSGDFNGDKIPDLLSFSSTQIFFHYQLKDTIAWQTIPFHTEKKISSVATERCNSDKLWDIVLLRDSPPQVEVYLAGTREQFSLAWSVTFQHAYEHMTLGDINSDGKIDILLYGKKTLGVMVYLGNGNGTFKAASKLFSEYTFSNLKILDMNGDGISDIAAIQWVENEVLVFYAYARMKYREPVRLQFNSEPMTFSAAQVDKNGSTILWVALENEKELLALQDDGSGNFVQNHSVQLPSSPSTLITEKITSEETFSLFVLLPDISQIYLAQYEGSEGFTNGITFSSGNYPRDGCIINHQLTTFKNLAVLHTGENRIRIYYNSNISSPKEEALSYMAGSKPNGVVSFNLGRNLNVAVSHAGSNFLLLFQRSISGVLGGPLALTTTAMTGNLLYLIKNDSTISFIGENVEENRVSTFEMHTSSFIRTITSFPSRSPQVLAATFLQKDGLLRLVVLEEDRTSHERNVVFFEQTAGGRFTEEITKEVPSENLITAAAAFESNVTYLWYTSFNKRKNRLETFSIQRKEHHAAVQPQPIFDVPLGPVQKGFLWNQDVNNDGRPDFILLTGDPFDTLFCFVADKQGKYRPSLIPQVSPVNVLSRERLKFFDVNNDGNIDIVLDNSITKTIQVYLGKGEGTFSEPHRLISSEGFGGFTLCDINADGTLDLVVTDAANGYVKTIIMKATE
jgi:hypothetical protein